MPADFLPEFQACEHGELVVVTWKGTRYILHPQEAEDLFRQLARLMQMVSDAKTRAGGIEPRSGEPI